MTLKKSRNIRKIEVEGVKYYWVINYDEDYGIIGCFIGLEEQPNYRFHFYRGASDKHQRYIMNGIGKEDEVDAITPGLVRQAIVFANANLDWKNTKGGNIYADAQGFSIE